MEKYSDEECIDVLAIVCENIDKFDLAEFTNEFSEWDGAFEKSDFMYDFCSIVIELEDLFLYLNNPTEKIFDLNFYECGRIITFELVINSLKFTISDSYNSNIIYVGLLDRKDFARKIHDLIVSFKNIINMYFPLALKIFKNNNFLPGAV